MDYRGGNATDSSPYHLFLKMPHEVFYNIWQNVDGRNKLSNRTTESTSFRRSILRKLMSPMIKLMANGRTQKCVSATPRTTDYYQLYIYIHLSIKTWRIGSPTRPILIQLSN